MFPACMHFSSDWRLMKMNYRPCASVRGPALTNTDGHLSSLRVAPRRRMHDLSSNRSKMGRGGR